MNQQVNSFRAAVRKNGLRYNRQTPYRDCSMTLNSSRGAQTEPRLDYVMCASPAGAHRMAYWEWGDPDCDQVLLCVHGLTRTGRDFDDLARRLSSHYRVICPDVAGRGKSDWLINAGCYVIPQYVADMLTLIARLGSQRLDWVGTSMGGLIALALAGTLTMSEVLRPDRGPNGLPPDLGLRLGKIVLNDIGPSLNFSGLARIAGYVGMPVYLDSFEQAVEYVRSVSAGFGEHDQAGWEQLARHVFTEQNGKWVKHYDLRLAEPFALQDEETMRASESMLWKAYEDIDTPVLVMRGAQSDLLTADTAREMLERNPNAVLHEVPKVGHAPMLNTTEQIASVERFLLA
jgi:pimeloyl-ACP methyl ester carboxylesterase